MTLEDTYLEKKIKSAFGRHVTFVVFVRYSNRDTKKAFQQKILGPEKRPG
jgi:hypothetical protein